MLCERMNVNGIVTYFKVVDKTWEAQYKCNPWDIYLIIYLFSLAVDQTLKTIGSDVQDSAFSIHSTLMHFFRIYV